MLLKLQKLIFKWFSYNPGNEVNTDKSHLISNGKEKRDIKLENRIIESSSSRKLLGIDLT